MSADTQLPNQPGSLAVRNRTAWLAAFGPLISQQAAGFIVGLGFGNVQNWNGLKWMLAYALWVSITYQFIRYDRNSLKSQGFDPDALNIRSPVNLPMYLFSRARAFGHSKAYAITWCVVAVVSLVFEFA